jgi:hypothetical protein
VLAPVLAALLATSLGACASGAERSTLPGDAQNAAPARVAPEGLTEVRESLAAMRAENREAMDATLIQSRPLSQTPQDGFFGRMLGFLGRGISDAITLSALGL